jgi:hemoglobin
MRLIMHTKLNLLGTIVAVVGGIIIAGCGGKQVQQKDFFTSGSRDADQRAAQRIAKTNQIRGTSGAPNLLAPVKKSLYERLGADAGITAIVDDFITRALADPRVNWQRKGTTRGGFLGIGKKSASWDASPEHVVLLKAHIVQFLSLASGGPAKYEGRDMRQVHRGMNIDNSEFDAAVGDLKAAMDRLQIATAEQKELIAILESTRPEIVEKR